MRTAYRVKPLWPNPYPTADLLAGHRLDLAAEARPPTVSSKSGTPGATNRDSGWSGRPPTAWRQYGPSRTRRTWRT